MQEPPEARNPGALRADVPNHAMLRLAYPVEPAEHVSVYRLCRPRFGAVEALVA